MQTGLTAVEVDYIRRQWPK